MESDFTIEIELLDEVDFNSSLEDKIDCFRSNYLKILDVTEEKLNENPFFALAYLSNIMASVCDESDYEYDEEDYLLETCTAVVLSNKLDEAVMDLNLEMFKEIIKKFLLKEEKYELLNAIKNA